MWVASIRDMKYRSVNIMTAKVPWDTTMGTAMTMRSLRVWRLKCKRPSNITWRTCSAEDCGDWSDSGVGNRPIAANREEPCAQAKTERRMPASMVRH